MSSAEAYHLPLVGLAQGLWYQNKTLNGCPSSPSLWLFLSYLRNLKNKIHWPQRLSFRNEELYFREFERKKHFELVMGRGMLWLIQLPQGTYESAFLVFSRASSKDISMSLVCLLSMLTKCKH